MEDAPKKAKKVKPGSFESFGLSKPVLKAIQRIGYRNPTPIQRRAIPPMLEGQDVVAMARTGSGKTAAFLIPIIERLKTHSVAVGVRAVVLSPTRELAMQTAKFFHQLTKFVEMRCCLLVGGQAMETQFEHLAANPDIVVATPGRLMHHMLEAELSLSRIEILVFDEADRLFELGFAEQLQKILESCPLSRQCLLVSATLPAQLVSFSRAGIKNPVFVRLDVETSLSEALELWFLYTRKEEKVAAAIAVLRHLVKGGKSTIMFVATRHHVEFFGELLERLKLPASIVYGSMDQSAREAQVASFRNHRTQILVTTDVAARGVDIPMLDHVLNFDFPPSAKLFVHRSGRTARAGRSGLSVSLTTLDDLPYTVELMLFLGCKIGIAGAPDQEAENNRPTNGNEKKVPEPVVGAVPPLDHEVETLNNMLTEEDGGLRSLYKSMMSSYQVYNKMRQPASKQSVLRSREMLDACGGPAVLQGLTHPGLAEATTDDRSTTSKAFIQELRTYRPKAEKVGNVLSTASMNTMKQAKLDVNAMTAACVSSAAASQASRAAMHAEAARVATQGVDVVEEVLNPAKATVERAPVPRHQRKKRKFEVREPTDEHSGWDVKVDGVAVESDDEGPKKKKGKPQQEQFYLSVKRDRTTEAVERGMEMEKYQLDMVPDGDTEMKKAKSVIRWDAKKKKYLPVMIAADGRVVKQQSRKNESGQKVEGEATRSNMYKKWSQSTKKRIQRVGELEEGKVPLGRFKNVEQRSSIEFDDYGTEVTEKTKKPLVPFHGQIEDKFLTNKQKRLKARREKNDRVLEATGVRREVKSVAQMTLEKKKKEENKTKQNPALRKKRRKEIKEKNKKRRDEKLMEKTRTKSKMLVIEGSRKKAKQGPVKKGYGGGFGFM